MYYVISIILGLLPEVLYFTLFLIYTKDLKEKKLKLFALISIAYFICLLIQQLNILYYIILLALIYAILKLLYKNKTQITDIFIIGISYLWLAILSALLLLLLDENYTNYYYMYIVDRILLFLPFIFRNKFNTIYKKYYSLWNRNDNEKRPIKSITLRNISLILLNSLIFFLNITIINIVNFFK